MRLSPKPVWFVIGIHAACLAVGFWFLIQLVISSTEHQAFESVQSELTERSQHLVQSVRELRSDELESVVPAFATFQKLATGIPDADHTGILVVNETWDVSHAVTSAATRVWQLGDHVTWKGERHAPTMVEVSKGRVLTSKGERAAICYPLAESKARLVIFDSRPVVPLWRTQLLSDLPLAVAIAMFWTLSLSSVLTLLFSARLRLEDSNNRTQRDHDALKSAQDLLRTRDAVIFGLAKLAESRDSETGHHLERISLYCTHLAMALRSHPKYQAIVTPTFVRLLGLSSVLHDIGKVGVEDAVLLKPGSLTEVERKKMQQHTLVGGNCLRDIEQRLGASNFLQMAREIAMCHHERWDGKGYPMGLAGDAIPLTARIIAISDVYDALASKRCYKEAYPHDRCVRDIAEGAGTQFDPDLVEAFLAIEAEYAAIARRFAVDATHPDIAPSEGETVEGEAARMTPAQESLVINVLMEHTAFRESIDRSSSRACCAQLASDHNDICSSDRKRKS